MSGIVRRRANNRGQSQGEQAAVVEEFRWRLGDAAVLRRFSGSRDLLSPLGHEAQLEAAEYRRTSRRGRGS